MDNKRDSPLSRPSQRLTRKIPPRKKLTTSKIQNPESCSSWLWLIVGALVLWAILVAVFAFVAA